MSLRLYDLLPEIYRTYDAKGGRPLEALLSTLQMQYDAVEANIEALYDGWFIETCADWITPYIAALLGVEGLESEKANVATQRARVGNAQLYRSHKGSMAVLARAAADASGWAAMADDSLDRMVCAQTLRALRPGLAGSSRLSGPETAIWIDTPFSNAARTASFRAGGAGPLSPGRATLNLWRLQAYPMEGVTPAPQAGSGYSFSPLGVDTPLFMVPRTPDDLFAPPTAGQIPMALSNRRLAQMVARRRAGAAVAAPFAIHVRMAGGWQAIPLEAVAVMDLPDWSLRPPAQVRWGDAPGQVATIQAAVDAERGRLVLAQSAAAVAVDYAYGFGMDIGGGPYDRRDRMTPLSLGRWNAVVASDRPDHPPPTAGPGVYQSLEAALADWALTGRSGRIQIADNATYAWPTAPLAIGGRALIVEAANGCRPCVLGPLSVQTGKDADPATLELGGLWMPGPLILTGDLQLNVADCTLGPGSAAAILLPDGAVQPSPRIALSRSIVGPITVPVGSEGLQVSDSILDGGLAPEARAAELSRRIGLGALAGSVAVARCTRLGAFPLIPTLPPSATATPSAPRSLDAQLPTLTQGRAVAAARFGQPAYARPLERRVAPGHERIGQPGAYYALLNGQRERNLEPVKDEFLPQALSLHRRFAD